MAALLRRQPTDPEAPLNMTLTAPPRMIFVNLPVTRLDRAVAFYRALGAERNDRFSDDTAAAMTVSESIVVMLLTHEKFRRFTPRPVCDARRASEVFIALSANSRKDVDATVARALESGGAEPRPPQDHGVMYGRSVEDPDGHIWEIMWMDPDAFDTPSAAI